VAPGEAGAAGGAGFGAGESLGARDSPRPGDAGGQARTAAREDEVGDGWTGDGGGPGGAAQAELSTTTRVSVPNRAHFTAHHLFVSGKQPCCKDQAGALRRAAGAATSRWHCRAFRPSSEQSSLARWLSWTGRTSPAVTGHRSRRQLSRATARACSPSAGQEGNPTWPPARPRRSLDPSCGFPAAVLRVPSD
jgi:hypothetical protein